MDLITLAMAKAYTDKKAGYVEASEAVIFENLAVSGGEADTTVTTQMIPGKTYIVTVGGVKYERVCYTEAFDGIACVGNARLYDFVNEDNGDDFFVGQARETIVQCYTRNMGDTTITLAEKTETVHPIDPKYLPGVCLPVVELSTALANETALTDAESALLSTAFEGGAPVVIRCTVYFSILEGMQVSGQFVFNPQLLPLGGQSSKVFGGVIYGINVMFIEAGENWICAIEESA